MPRHIKLGLIFFLIVAVAGSFYFYDLQKRIRVLVYPQKENTQPYFGEGPSFSASGPVRKAVLFFPSKDQDGLLEPEEREIYSSEQVSAEAKQIIAELIRGSRQDRQGALPMETKVREVYIVEGTLAIVDLTKEVSTHHVGGLTQEISSIYAIVDSLTQSLPAIQQVQILIEGSPAETLAGHVDLSRPFSENLSMTSLPRKG